METIEENTEPDSLSVLIKSEGRDTEILTENVDVIDTEYKEKDNPSQDDTDKTCINLEAVTSLDTIPNNTNNSASKYFISHKRVF